MNSIKNTETSATLKLWIPGQDATTDRSGNGNTFSVTGSVPIVDGKIGKALSFSGSTSNYTRIASVITTSESGYVEMWVKPSSFAAVECILCSADEAGTGSYIYFGTNTTGTIRVAVQSASPFVVSNVFRSTAAMTLNRWNHIIVASSGTAYTFYLNGVLTATVIDGGANNGKWFAAVNPRTATVIGMLKRSTSSNPYTGLVSGIKISDKTMTAKIASLIYFQNRGIQ